MELEEVWEEHASAEATSEHYLPDPKSSIGADPYKDINTRNIGLLLAAVEDDTKRVQLAVGEEHVRPKYKKESRYRRYSDHDEENLNDPLWSTMVQPYESSQLQPDTEEYDGDDEPQPLTTSVRLSFLEHFDALPTIDEISSTLSEEFVEMVEEEPRLNSLAGKFVDPLTGIEIAQESFHSIQMEEESEEFVDFSEEDETDEHQIGIDSCETLGITEDSELLELQEMDAEMDQIEETKVAQPEEEEVIFDVVSKQVRTQDKKFDEVFVEDTKRQNEIVVATFLDDLLQLIVERSEYKEPLEVLSKTINKRKLMAEISEKLRELEVEQTMRLHLHRKVVEYHKRKKLYRAIIEDAPNAVDYLKQKYKEQLENYDKAMGKEAELANVMNAKTENLKKIEIDGERRVQEKILEFEEIVKRTLMRGRETIMSNTLSKKQSEGKPDIGKNIFALLNRLNTAGKEISDTRLALIKKQHLFAELKERLHQLQNIGNGLNLSHFEQLQNEVTQLSKKNEERNSELVRARTKRVINVHINTHMKEAVNMLKSALDVKRISHATLVRELEEARRTVYQQKQLRGEIRREAKEYYHQGGLLSKPTLMLDYDRTMEEIATKEVSIAALRAQFKKINDKIAYYENILASRLKSKLR